MDKVIAPKLLVNDDHTVSNRIVLEALLSEASGTAKNIGMPRIANTLSVNIAAPKQPSLFKELNAEQSKALIESDEEYKAEIEKDKKKTDKNGKPIKIIDVRNGKPVNLSVEQIKLIKYISSLIPFLDSDVKESMDIINTMDAQGTLDKTPSPVQIPISLIDACKEIIGTAKERDIKTMGKRLLTLSKWAHVQTFKIGKEEYKVVRPLIMINEQIYKKYSEVRSTKGRRKKDSSKEEEEILLAANVVLSSIFLFEAQNKYCPFYKERYFLISKKNKTELFQILLSDLESKFKQYRINHSKAEEEYKKNNKDLLRTNKEEYYKGLGLAKKNALTYKCSLALLRSRVTTDYESQRAYRAKFQKDVQKALASCIEYGIITEKSHVSKDKQNLILVYNPKFTDTQIEEADAEEV